MNDVVHAEMNEYWNGTGGEKCVTMHNRTDMFLRPLGAKAIRAAENKGK
jgi:hypothetical protein